MEDIAVTLADSIPVQDQLALYRDAGWWNEHDSDAGLPAIVKGSFITAVARTPEGRIIGMGRMISDGASDGYIQDVAVLKDYQGKGLGAGIVRLLAAEGRRRGLSWIGLVAAPGTRQFYEKLGFAEMKDHVPMLLSSSAEPGGESNR